MDGNYMIPDFISKDVQDLLTRILTTDPEKRLSINEIKSHPWFSINYPIYKNEGLIFGYNRIPIQDEILKIMETKEFDPQYVERCIDANKHNH